MEYGDDEYNARINAANAIGTLPLFPKKFVLLISFINTFDIRYCCNGNECDKH